MKVGGGEQGVNSSSGEVRASLESHKQALHKDKNIDLQLDLEKNSENRNSAANTATNKLNQATHKQQQQSNSEKPGKVEP